MKDSLEYLLVFRSGFFWGIGAGMLALVLGALTGWALGAREDRKTKQSPP